MDKATIVYLHGATGSGKTSLALELQERLEEFFLRFSLDSIWEGFPKSIIERKLRREDISDVRCPSVGRGYIECVEALASLGFNLIIDDNLADDIVREHVLTRLKEFRVFLGGLDCPLEELVARESERYDREPGTAESDSMRLHKSLEFDLVLDTSKNSVEEAAMAIVRQLERRGWIAGSSSRGKPAD